MSQTAGAPRSHCTWSKTGDTATMGNRELKVASSEGEAVTPKGVLVGDVWFASGQPAAALVQGIAAPRIEGALCVVFDQWPKSLEAIATQLGTLAAEKLK